MRWHRAPKSVPLAFHQDHQVVIKPSTKPPHEAYYWCVGCKKWVSWLSKKDAKAAKELGLINFNQE
jgi:hypothetical protein